MLDSKGRVQNGTPLHRLHNLLAAGGLMLHALAGDVLDVCEHVGDPDETVAALAESARERIEKAERAGVPMAVRAADLKHLVDVATNPRASAESEEGDDKPAAPAKRTRGRKNPEPEGNAGGSEGSQE